MSVLVQITSNTESLESIPRYVYEELSHLKINLSFLLYIDIFICFSMDDKELCLDKENT